MAETSEAVVVFFSSAHFFISLCVTSAHLRFSRDARDDALVNF